ncbi:MAG: glycosyltransferase family 4 protein [Candidatus Uhrbacteria bacterium]|nr:glycosyltransferase family 4 protein [Candidatus Uhrbacteria bacterium]
MSEQHEMDWLKLSNIFIWQGGWKGGAETVMFEIAKFLKETHNITPTLGLFEGNLDSTQPFPQIEVKTIFPKHLVAYNNIAAPILSRKQLEPFDLIITHEGGFWKTKSNHYIYREPGDLFRLFSALPFKSKIGYAIPLLASLYGLHTADIPIAASYKAEWFFKKVHVPFLIRSSNFIDTKIIPVATKRSHTNTEPFVLTFIGRDDKIKNLAWLERACSNLPSSMNVHLHVFGVKKQDTQNITYHGWVEERTIWQFLQDQTHAFVLSSLFEASPLVLLQALACGIPSLVKTSALPDELSSFVLPFNSEKDFITTLQSLIENYEEHAQKSSTNATTVRTTYDKQTVLTAEFVAIGQKILGEHL